MTIRRLVKRVTREYQVNGQGVSEVIIHDYHSGRLIYKINKDFLIKRLDLRSKEGDKSHDDQEIVTDNQNAYQNQNNDYQSDSQENFINDSMEITKDYLETMKIQLVNKDEEIKRLHKLLENQQILNVETLQKLAEPKKLGIKRFFGFKTNVN